jgi:single-stranded-DNA-specific exonuclease
MTNFKINNTFEPVLGASIDYLRYFGIKEVDSFLYKPKPSDYESPWKLDNMQQMIDALHDGFINKKHFFLQVDSDTDGMISSAIFYNYFTTLYPNANITYRVHEGKEHGVILDTIPVWTDIVVIPDAGSNQLDEHEVMSNEGRTVLIMDHHNVTRSMAFDNVIIVNNQTSPNFKNKDLSGAGVVFKVIQAYDEVYGKKILYKRYEDLAALGIVADCMDSKNLDNNAIIRNGLSVIYNNLFKALIDHQKDNPGWKGKDGSPCKIDVAFYIAPLINGVIRSGTLEEKTQFFEGFINCGSEDIITSMSRGRLREETLYQYLARTAYNLKNRQNTAKEKALLALQQEVEDKGLNKNKVIIIRTDKIEVPQNITGLAAMDISKIYNKPTLILRPVKENGKTYYRGSGRAPQVEGFYDFQHTLLASGLMDYCEGHDNAFGASVLVENLAPLTAWLNDYLKDIDFTPYEVVDCEMTDEKWSAACLKEFGEMYRVYGNGIPEPKFFFNFNIRPSDARVIGTDSTSLRIQYKGITFVTFKNAELIKQFNEISSFCNKNGLKINVQIAGAPSINEWQGYKNVQIQSRQIEIGISNKKSSLF